MKPKAIICDIDGTLLNSRKQLSERNRSTLIEAQKQGIKLVLASGRPTTGMMRLAHELEMDKHHGLLVSFNGACVVDCENGNILFIKTMTAEEASSVLEHLKGFDVIPMISKDDTMYVNDVFKGMLTINGKPFNIIEYESRGGNYRLCEIRDLAAFADYPMNKILVAAEADYLKNNFEAIRAPFTDKLSSMFTAPFYYEFTAQGIDKAAALNAVLVPMGINPQDTWAFGDGQNDLSIIHFAGKGIAMGNAVDELKQAADMITLSHDDDGIAVVLDPILAI